MDKRSKDTGTFVVKIIDSQNATWQGSVAWIEGQKEQYFRSVLELLKLIDGAMGQGRKEEGGCHEK